MHFRNDTLDFALLITTYSPSALENISPMRHATNELTVIFRIITFINDIRDQVTKRAAHRIRPGVLDTGVHAIDNYRRRKQSGDTEVAFVDIVCYSITVAISWRHNWLGLCRTCAKEKCHGAHRQKPPKFTRMHRVPPL